MTTTHAQRMAVKYGQAQDQDAKNKNTVRQYGKLIEYLTTGNQFVVNLCKGILARQGTTPTQAVQDAQWLESVIGAIEDYVVKMKEGRPV